MILAKITRLKSPELIAAFFGTTAKPYDYTVTEEDWAEYDSEAPGRYYGVEVPPDMAAKWDAGILACRQSGVPTKGAAGLVIRLAHMYPEGASSEAKELVAKHLARLAAKAQAIAALPKTPSMSPEQADIALWR